MPDRRIHRGPHPEDARLFAPPSWPALQAATADLSWLLSRNYALPSALKLVGDHLQLAERQRTAVMRSACSDESLARRTASHVAPPALAGHALHLDGYNVLATLESALAGAVIIQGRDGCYRDMASMHGHYKRVHETAPALELLGTHTAALGITRCHWLLDAPVSNSGRLKAIILQAAAAHGWAWTVDLVPSPDFLLARATPDQIIVTADSVVLDGVCTSNGPPTAPRWFNLTRHIIAASVPTATIIPMGT